MVSRTKMFYYFAIRTLVTCDDFEILSTALAVSFVIKKKKKAVLRAGAYYAKTKREIVHNSFTCVGWRKELGDYGSLRFLLGTRIIILFFVSGW